jgi:hypothetical protein
MYVCMYVYICIYIYVTFPVTYTVVFENYRDPLFCTPSDEEALTTLANSLHFRFTWHTPTRVEK